MGGYKHRKHHHPRRPVTNRLRVLRAERQWTQDDLAERMGLLSKFRVWQLEQELAAPLPFERQRLARIFRCPVARIFPPSRRRRREVA